jgi:cytidylate kinase
MIGLRQFMKRIITLDGGAATGKSTAMLRLSRALGWHGVSTGHVYRAAAMLAMAEEISPEQAPVRLAARLQEGALSYNQATHTYFLNRPGLGARALPVEALTSPEVSARTPVYSRIPEVRAALMEFQRGLYRDPGLVADGRDCGTVVYPDAILKIWLTVDGVEAARRLHRGQGVPFEQAYVDVLERDRLDRNRGTAPMAAAADAVVVDTTRLSADEVFAVVLELSRRKGLTA